MPRPAAPPTAPGPAPRRALLAVGLSLGAALACSSCSERASETATAGPFVWDSGGWWAGDCSDGRPADTGPADAGGAADVRVGPGPADADVGVDATDAPPSVTITSPAAGAFVGGWVDVTAVASDDRGVAKVRFLVDDLRNVAGLTQAPFSFEWDTGLLEEGEHTLTAVAEDTAGQTAEDRVRVTVDATPPVVELLAPEPDAHVHDSVPFAARVSDAGGLERVEVLLRGEEPALVLDAPPWEGVLDTSELASGPLLLRVRAVDRAGLSGTAERELLLDRPPIVTLLAPQDGETVTGPTDVRVRAADDLGLETVEVLVDGALVGSTTDADGAVAWVPAYRHGERVLGARATDTLGQRAEAEVRVLVDHPLEITLTRCRGEVCRPLGDDEATGALHLGVQARDDDGQLLRAELSVDDVPVAVDEEAPFVLVWDTTAGPDGERDVRVQATSDSGATAEARAAVRVNNCDLDHDGHPSDRDACGGDDCVDLVAAVHPDRDDPAGDGHDLNCDGADGIDADGDGHASEATGGGDCNDADPSVHPCADDAGGDGADANCDGADAASCDDCSPCTRDEHTDGGCRHEPDQEGAACDDGNACTVNETCTAGQCSSLEGLGCVSLDSCVVAFCDPVGGCQHLPSPDGSECPEGVCFTGACEGWVRVPPGELVMGSPRGEAGRDDNEAPHRVRITRPFLLKATEVTQGEWRALMGTSPAHFAACGDACPIEWVNWYEAAAYCNARSRSEALPECYELEGCFHEPGEDMECQAVRFAGLDCPGYRLPTEAEWEHAARAGTTGAVYDEEEPWRIVGVHHAPALDPIAWYGGNSGTDFPGAVDCSNLAEPHHPADRCGPHPVAQKRPNPWGLYDMLGNIWEWTWDRYAADYGGFGEPDRPVLDPLGPGNGAQRVVRGGSWGHDAAGVRAAARAGFGQTAGCLGAMVGFRPARSLPEPGAGD